MQTSQGPKILGPGDGKAGSLGMIGVRFMIDGAEAGDRFSLVEHPMPPRALAAPLHLHTREDEYSFVLEGRMGALLGDDVVEAGPGDLVHKPRDQWHTFWNAGDEPCRILEIISPAGFEKFFEELVEEVLEAARGDDLEDRARLVARVPERVPLVARLVHEVAGVGVDDVVAEQRGPSGPRARTSTRPRGCGGAAELRAPAAASGARPGRSRRRGSRRCRS